VPQEYWTRRKMSFSARCWRSFHFGQVPHAVSALGREAETETVAYFVASSTWACPWCFVPLNFIFITNASVVYALYAPTETELKVRQPNKKSYHFSTIFTVVLIAAVCICLFFLYFFFLFFLSLLFHRPRSCFCRCC